MDRNRSAEHSCHQKNVVVVATKALTHIGTGSPRPSVLWNVAMLPKIAINVITGHKVNMQLCGMRRESMTKLGRLCCKECSSHALCVRLLSNATGNVWYFRNYPQTIPCKVARWPDTHDCADRNEDNNQLNNQKGESNNTTRGSRSNTWPLEQEPCMMTSHTLQQSEYNSCMHHAVK